MDINGRQWGDVGVAHEGLAHCAEFIGKVQHDILS